MTGRPSKKRTENQRTARRRLTPGVRRSELLAAALKVLRNYGTANIRVEDVTREAGAAKGTFFRYFPSWDSLLLALRDYLLSTYGSDLRVRFTKVPAAGWWKAFEAECIRFVDFIIDLGGVHKAVFHGPIADRPRNPQYSSKALIAELLTAGIAAGQCRPVDVEIAASLLFSLLHATSDAIAQFGDREQRIDTTIELLRRWLRLRKGDDDERSHAPADAVYACAASIKPDQESHTFTADSGPASQPEAGLHGSGAWTRPWFFQPGDSARTAERETGFGRCSAGDAGHGSEAH